MRTRVPPNAIEVEKHVIGGLLLGDDEATAVFERLRPEDFYVEKHQALFESLCALYAEGKQITLISLGEALQKAGLFAKAGGDVYMMEISAEVVSSANMAAHAEIIKEKSILRRLIQGTSQIQDSAYNPQKAPAEVLGEAETLLLSLADEKYQQGLLPFGSILPETFALLSKNAAGSMTGVPTGLRDVDAITGGLQPTDLIVLAGRPGMGKTALGLTISWKAAKLGKKVAFFSMEMGKHQLTQRILCAPKNTNLHHIRTNRQTPEDMENIRAAVTDLGSIPLHIDDASRKTPLQILSQCKRMKKKYGLDLVLIDYLQLGKLDKETDNRSEYVGEFARGMKAAAKDLEIPFVGLAQLNREVEHRNTRVPQLSDLKESGGIEEAADCVGFLLRPEVYDNKAETGLAEIHWAKYRNGPAGEVTALRFNKESASFSDYIAPTLLEKVEHGKPINYQRRPPRNTPPKSDWGDPGYGMEPHRGARPGEAGWD